jgi:hypothetical protein
VPAEYFLLTFTLPAQLRALAVDHQRVVYDALLRASWDTLRTFSQNDKQLRGTPGAIAVLHTHSRRLNYHPHVHVIMPAAAIDTTRRLWRTETARRGSPWLFAHKALAKVFRAKMLDALHQAGLSVPRAPERWVVDCKPVGKGTKALVYLGRYLYRGVIRKPTSWRARTGVTVRYMDAKARRWQTRTLPGADFLWLVLQHVLPRRFRRTRNFGFLHPNSKRLIALVHGLLKVDLASAKSLFKPRPGLTCSECGSAMKVVRTRLPPPRRMRERPLDGMAACAVM